MAFALNFTSDACPATGAIAAQKVVSSLPPRTSQALGSIPRDGGGSLQLQGAAERPSLHAQEEPDPRGQFGARRSRAEQGVMAQSPVEHVSRWLSWGETRLCPACAGCLPAASAHPRRAPSWHSRVLGSQWRQLVHPRLARDVHQRARPWVGSPANSYQVLEPKQQKRAEGSLPSLLVSLHQLLLASISQIRCEQMGRARSTGSAPRSPEHKR